MKTKEEIQDKIYRLRIEKSIIGEKKEVLNKTEVMNLEGIMHEIAILRWVLNNN